MTSVLEIEVVDRTDPRDGKLFIVEAYGLHEEDEFPRAIAIGQKIPNDVVAWKRIRQWFHIAHSFETMNGKLQLILEGVDIDALEGVILHAFNSELSHGDVKHIKSLLPRNVK